MTNKAAASLSPKPLVSVRLRERWGDRAAGLSAGILWGPFLLGWAQGRGGGGEAETTIAGTPHNEQRGVGSEEEQSSNPSSAHQKQAAHPSLSFLQPHSAVTNWNDYIHVNVDNRTSHQRADTVSGDPVIAIAANN